MGSRATLKSYFNTGDFPTEAQFAEFIDSVPNFADDGGGNVPPGFLTLGDENYSLDAGTTPRHIVYDSPLSADRTITLSTTDHVAGDEYVITRTENATGNFDLNIGTVLSIGPQWSVHIIYTGTKFILA